MLQNHPQQMLHSPARLGLPNPNSPSTLIPSTPPPKLSSSSSSSSQQQQQPQPPPNPTAPTSRISPTLLPLLPPLPRAQSLLTQMAALATKLFDVSPNRSIWLASYRGSLPTFHPSQHQQPPPPPSGNVESSSPSSTREVLTQFTSLQNQLFEAVGELQEILDLQDVKLKLAREIRAKDAAILSFAKKLKDAQHVLDLLADDYADYRRPKRTKLSAGDDGDAASSSVGEELSLADILSYAHKISYTTFAPPEFGAGQAPLRGALPPAPQEEQMRASQLYAFVDLDVGLPKTAEAKEKAVETLIEAPPPLSEGPLVDLAALQGMLIPPPPAVPAGWRPGMPVDLPRDILKVPPGWKVGDPVPLPPLDIPLPRKDEEQRPLGPMPGMPMPSKPPETYQVKHISLDIEDEYSSDYSEEASSDESD
ncbi:Mediator of RNA polymerase II transcription subunit 4 [Asimina triloba]